MYYIVFTIIDLDRIKSVYEPTIYECNLGEDELRKYLGFLKNKLIRDNDLEEEDDDGYIRIDTHIIGCEKIKKLFE